MSVLVVGSVALDSIETPFGKVERVVGGSATYFTSAASLYAKVNLVGVVGEDFPKERVEFLQDRGADLRGLQVVPGRTFHWQGRYDFDLNVAHTLDTQLNVFATFHPELPQDYRKPRIVFLANIDPDLQVEVLDQVEGAELSVLDTMNFWITSKKESLLKAISRVNVVCMNEAEARQLVGSYSLLRAAREILSLGPDVLVVKKGEYGAVMFTESGYFVAPAYPLESVKDPTGAGDSFAGGFIGYLAEQGIAGHLQMRRAMIHGSVVASFAVEDFSIERLKRLTRAEVQARYREFQHITYFEALDPA